MRSPLVAVVAVLALVAVAVPLAAQEYQEPKSKVAFAIDEAGLLVMNSIRNILNGWLLLWGSMLLLPFPSPESGC